MSHLAFQTQLEDPEFVFRSINFSNFVSTWLIRFVDPKHLHPEPLVECVSLCCTHVVFTRPERWR